MSNESNKSLVLIVNEAMVLEQMLIEAGGEITEGIDKALAVNSAELAIKLDAYVEILKRFESLEDHYKARAEFFSKISGQCKNAGARLKDNIKFAMNELGVSELAGLEMRFKLTETSGSLTIKDKDLIPVEFKSEVTETVIDTKAVKAALTAGKEVPGADLVKSSSLRSYANTQVGKSKTKEVVK